MNYLIGDLQGCCDALERLLARSTSRPRATASLRARRPRQPRPAIAGDAAPPARPRRAATCLLGNHDLNLLAVAHGVRKPHRGDTMDARSSTRRTATPWLTGCASAALSMAA
jgi:bis(5'-nucleosyl)-tetraphosphatase (symmetrical)